MNDAIEQLIREVSSGVERSCATCANRPPTDISCIYDLDEVVRKTGSYMDIPLELGLELTPGCTGFSYRHWEPRLGAPARLKRWLETRRTALKQWWTGY